MLIKENARIVLCGAISTYNETGNPPYALKNYSRMIIKKAAMQGFLYMEYGKQFPSAIQ